MQYEQVLVCTDWDATLQTCGGFRVVQAYLIIDPSEMPFGSIDGELVSVVFGGVLLLFCVGMGIGLIIAQIRKARFQ